MVWCVAAPFFIGSISKGRTVRQTIVGGYVCCPMCQEFPKEKWVDARREDILDAPYFHVVFTVPEELNPIIYSNQKFLYTALYHAASDTLSELAADSKYLGTDIGYICILHTWGSTMNFHPHIHAIVLGGGLDVKNHWKDNGKEGSIGVRPHKGYTICCH